MEVTQAPLRKEAVDKQSSIDARLDARYVHIGITAIHWRNLLGWL